LEQKKLDKAKKLRDEMDKLKMVQLKKMEEIE
jgi:hypothetical protein